MIRKLSIWTAAHFAAVAVMAIAQTTTPSAAQQPGAGDPAQIDQGKVTYAQKCSHCHGPNMVNSGTITPDLRTVPDDKARFITTVKLGKSGKMPPWGDLLSDDQIADLWAYVSSRRNP
ncbi:c-type cytochrome [Bradyrhizobium sp.]|uniref:c-type cytochrome n=1 Tax=Bradyrhizobium sp. TaxID=376 RepID=UPI003C7558C9